MIERIRYYLFLPQAVQLSYTRMLLLCVTKSLVDSHRVNWNSVFHDLEVLDHRLSLLRIETVFDYDVNDTDNSTSLLSPNIHNTVKSDSFQLSNGGNYA